MPSDQEHNDAIEDFVQDPKSAAKARRVLALAKDDPASAHEARERVAPSPQPLGLDLVHEQYHRHNLHMPRRPRRIAKPGNLEQLTATMQEAADAWHQIKAIGDGYGFDNVGFTRGYLIPMVTKLNRVLPLQRGVIKDGVDEDHLCHFEAGATIETINRHLWGQGQSLWNQPGYEKLTFVGTMSSGGHGSGTWLGPLSSQVRSLRLVTLNPDHRVRQYQIEPKDGISDETKFKAQNPGIELYQNDKAFHACTVGMGCLGVIYSVIVETRDAYNVRETRKMHPWADIRARLPALLAEQGPGKRLHSIEVWINPYEVDGKVWCVLGEREETTDPPRNSRALAIDYGGPEFLYRLLSWFLRHVPDSLPCLMHAALDATEAADVVMHAPEGLNFGATNQAPVIACSCGVPSANIQVLADDLIDFFQKRRARHGAYISSPLGLRFVAAADAHMSPAHKRDTCMIEVPTLEGTPKGEETLDAYHDFLFEKYDGRPHWGQINNMPGSRLDKLYPELDKFLESFRVLNPKGFFDNAFTEQMGFRMRA